MRSRRLFPWVLLLLLAVGSILAVASLLASGASGYASTLNLLSAPSTYTVGSINTGGYIMNTTTLFGAAKTLSGTTISATWWLSSPLAGSLSVGGAPTLYVWLSATGVSATVSAALRVYTQSGSRVATLSTGSATLTVGSEAMYTVTLGSISAYNVPAGDVLALQVNVTSTVSVTLYYNTAATSSRLIVPLTTQPVTVGAPSFGRTATANGGSGATYTFQVNDSWGQYDLAGVSAVVVQPGGYPYKVNASASAPVQPTAYSATYTGQAEYLTGGVYTVYGVAVDNSGNTYQGAGSQLTVIPAGEGAVVWGVLVGFAGLLTVLGFMLPLRVADEDGRNVWEPGGLVLAIRSFVFPLLASIVWFVVAVFSATLGVFISQALLILFYGLGITMFVVFFALVFIFVRQSAREPRVLRGE